jgi:hypothetical protein
MPQDNEPKSWQNGWAQATLAWQICASIHRTYAKDKDPFFTTRQNDFINNTERARQKYLAQQPKDITMTNKRAARQFFTDEDYRKAIRKTAIRDIEQSIKLADDEERRAKNGTVQEEYYHPPVDMADVAANAIINNLDDRGGVNLDFDPEINREIADTVAEIVRQATAPDNNIYERTPTIDLHPYTQLNTPDLKSRDGEVYPQHIREFLFDHIIDKAIEHGEEPGGYTPVERCLRTARSIINAIDGGAGNQPIGQGLPLLQLILAPHPRYVEARVRHEEPMLPENEVMVDYGLLPPNDYQTGMADAFDRRFDQRFDDQIKARTIRAAKDLFEG